MRQGRYAEALPLLERQVMLDPANAGGWLDFALAHYQLGYFNESQAILDFIEREFSPPPAIRAVIARYRQPQGWMLVGLRPRWSAEIALLLGHESNANAGLGIRSLTLTFPDATLDLLLDPRYQPRSSSSVLMEARMEGQTPLGQSGLHAHGYLDWHERRLPEMSGYDTRQYRAWVALEGSLPGTWAGAAAVKWTAGAGMQQVDQGGQPLLRGESLRLALEAPLSACRIGGGAEAEQRSYPIQQVLDGRYQGVLASLACPLPGGQAYLMARYGHDRPDGPRAGGEQRREELGGTAQYPAGERGRLEISLSLARQTDREAYSALLGGTSRKIVFRNLRIEYAHRIAEGWEWLVRAESQLQTSNIELFGVKNETLHAGVRKRF